MRFSPRDQLGEGPATPGRCESLCQGTDRRHSDLAEMRVTASPAWNLDVAPVRKIFPACSLLTFSIRAVHVHKHSEALASHHGLTLPLNIWGEQISHYVFGIRKIALCLELVRRMTSRYESQMLQSNT